MKKVSLDVWKQEELLETVRGFPVLYDKSHKRIQRKRCFEKRLRWCFKGLRICFKSVLWKPYLFLIWLEKAALFDLVTISTYFSCNKEHEERLSMYLASYRNIGKNIFNPLSSGKSV